jgi:hypothetical protein
VRNIYETVVEKSEKYLGNRRRMEDNIKVNTIIKINELCTVARLWAGRSVARDFSFLQKIQTDTGGPLNFLFIGYQRFCPRGHSDRSLKSSARLPVMR